MTPAWRRAGVASEEPAQRSPSPNPTSRILGEVRAGTGAAALPVRSSHQSGAGSSRAARSRPASGRSCSAQAQPQGPRLAHTSRDASSTSSGGSVVHHPQTSTRGPRGPSERQGALLAQLRPVAAPAQAQLCPGPTAPAQYPASAQAQLRPGLRACPARHGLDQPAEGSPSIGCPGTYQGWPGESGANRMPPWDLAPRRTLRGRGAGWPQQAAGKRSPAADRVEVTQGQRD